MNPQLWGSVVDPKLIFSDPNFQEISDPAPDPTYILTKDQKLNFKTKMKIFVKPTCEYSLVCRVSLTVTTGYLPNQQI